MISTKFWDITSFSPLKFSRRFGRTFIFNFEEADQETRVKQATSVAEVRNLVKKYEELKSLRSWQESRKG
jgi:hypothetical protein